MEKKEKNRNSYSELPKGEDSSPVKTPKKEYRKSKENREIRILKKSKSVKEKTDPDRFSGDGINFRAKIIGIEHVFDARGNRMCQGALQKLKAAVKTSGDHKQKILLNISLNGIIIKDEKSGEVLHHHPIHKISFISQDTKDNRAFGYVFGCPQTGHRFFAIKTEKAASQVVVTLRDLFLVALEIKKKEIEKTIDTQKENSEQESENGDYTGNKISNGSSTSLHISYVEAAGDSRNQGINHDLLYSNMVLLPEEVNTEQPELNHSEPEAPVEALLDLQSEVNILQQGITQMDQSIASAVSQNLGISFSEDEVSESSSSSVPVAFQFKLDKLSSLYHETMSISSRSSSTSDYNVCSAENKQEDNGTPKKDSILNVISVASEASSDVPSVSVCVSSEISEANTTSDNDIVQDRYAVFLNIDSLPSIFDDPSIVNVPEEKGLDEVTYEENEARVVNIKSSTPIAFAELDPLGSQPYVDKRDFFQDLKNPPKKLLKDLPGVNDNLFDVSESDIQTNSHESLTFSDTKLNKLGSTDSQGISPLLGNPPKLPPKRSAGAPSFPVSSELQNNGSSDHAVWEFKNPFNPFLAEHHSNVLTSSNSPPPPPPRLPTKTSESSPNISPPPPRPPSRVNGIPTPPLPKRKVPLSTVNRTWFSFDQDIAPFTSVSLGAELETDVTPPLPSPARKLALPKSESHLLKSSSASNSPATVRRICNKNPYLGNTIVAKEINRDSKAGSVHNVSSRYSSIPQDGDVFSGAAVFNPFVESHNMSDVSAENFSPPLPPKPISHLRPSVQKRISSSSTPSYSSCSVSVTESSNGFHSSSSLMYSSFDESKVGSSSEALFSNSTDSQSDIFSQSGGEIVQPKSSSGMTEEEPNDLSPDSIFRRKSDPFADDFFLSLHKKSSCDTKSVSTAVDVSFDNIKATT